MVVVWKTGVVKEYTCDPEKRFFGEVRSTTLASIAYPSEESP